jgi:hypothetical protein
MGLSKKQIMWAGIILLGILAYVLFFKKRAKAVSVPTKVAGKVATEEQAKPETTTENEKWFSGADESYVGPQDCIEPCEKRFEFQRAKCFNQLNNGLTYNMPSSADECIRLAEANKINCVSKCSNTYPTNQNFNYDVRDNFKTIIERTLFEQGYI